ncbi:MAG TPA: ABC transporter permease subunit [Candidatus Baltobacteraceae bacterium]|nr:ABC transporter permease subunit [Candidatus Baltobacteraceae bacterium]
MWTSILADAVRHAELALGALLVACLAGAPLGALAANSHRLRTPIVGAAALGRTLPSIAVLMLLLPIVGVGAAPALIALGLLAVAPIVINVDLALRGVPDAVLDAATGLGMSARERFWRVSVPLALPLALAGVRTASVEVIASATLATFIGGGGLGDDIVRALQTNDTQLLLAACAVVAAMAFAAEFLLARAGARVEVAP